MLAWQRLALCQNFRDMRGNSRVSRIDNQKLFFNAECELLKHIGDGFRLVVRDAVKEQEVKQLPSLETLPGIRRRFSC